MSVAKGDLARALQDFVNASRSREFYEKLVSRRQLNQTLAPFLAPRLPRKRGRSDSVAGPVDLDGSCGAGSHRQVAARAGIAALHAAHAPPAPMPPSPFGARAAAPAHPVMHGPLSMLQGEAHANPANVHAEALGPYSFPGLLQPQLPMLSPGMCLPHSMLQSGAAANAYAPHEQQLQRPPAAYCDYFGHGAAGPLVLLPSGQLVPASAAGMWPAMPSHARWLAGSAAAADPTAAGAWSGGGDGGGAGSVAAPAALPAFPASWAATAVTVAAASGSHAAPGEGTVH
jgi:hypothetical protein